MEPDNVNPAGLSPDGVITAAELATVLRDNVPGAYEVWLVEDDGHDDPQDKHGHLHSVFITGGTVLLNGSPDYQDATWAWDTDDLAYDLYRTDRDRYTSTLPDDPRRFLRLPVT